MEEEINKILNKVKTEFEFSPESRYNFDSDIEFNKYKKALVHLKTKGFIKIERNRYVISELGMDIIDLGGWSKYQNFLMQEKINEKDIKQIEFEKSKVDLELAKKMLKEYPKTKLIARISIIIGICLAILEVIRALGLLNPNN
ncbi:hypothetical protein [Bizionia arctica]|uniref:Uncharacterized protein n=1 Tax=Bizionia arctica TaxID=1495645 RepID=A0A917LMU7_9FLAO|nr:hypothetical protein [Bizionia arctica]GGG44718.1 hypothetical protein GCM10010976_15400 [Bizionia arctica]